MSSCSKAAEAVQREFEGESSPHPLTPSPLGEGELEGIEFPKSWTQMGLLAQILGLGRAWKFALDLAGRRIYIPLYPRGKLLQSLSHGDLETLCERFGGRFIDLPSRDSLDGLRARHLRNQEILRGGNATLSRRHLRRIRRRTRQPSSG